MNLLPGTTRRLIFVTLTSLVLLTGFGSASGPAAPQKGKATAETFRARARVATDTAAGDMYLVVRLDKYSDERDLKAMESALASGGSDGFLKALRQAPVVGRVEVGQQTFDIRWARQKDTPKGRVISVVTDKPAYFVGAGVPGAKPRAGFDVAVIQLIMDKANVGEGSMAAAARVKPGGEAGVEVEDYATEPIKLSSVVKVIS